MAKFRLKIPAPKVRLRVRVNLNRVCPPTAAFPVRMVAATRDSKPPEPPMEVTFLKPLTFEVKPKRVVIGKKVKPKLEVRDVPTTGTLFHWGGQILLVCHRSPWHPAEWCVSEYTTGMNVHCLEKAQDGQEFLARVQRPTESEARFEAIFHLQRYGMTRMKRYYKGCKTRNRVTPKIRRYVDRDWNLVAR